MALRRQFLTIESVIKGLETVQYIAERDLAMVIFLANRLRKPLFLEGEPGVGKTEVACALSRLLGVDLIRLQCYEGLDASTAIYEWNYPKQLLQIRMEEGCSISTEELEQKIHSPKFIIQRPLLKAIAYTGSTAPVLLIDEIDRADEEFEAFLLEVLADFQITIPEIGTIRAKQKPMVVVTSNRTRDVHDALKRRCLYHWIEYPSPEKEYRIITTKFPHIEVSFAEKITRFTQKLRAVDFSKKPGVTETLDWARALIALHVEYLDDLVVKDTLGCILKHQDDIRKFKQERLMDSGTKASLPQSLAAKVTDFANFLRTRGLRAFPTGVTDALQGLATIELGNRHDFMTVLRVSLVNNNTDWKQFPRLFEEFWGTQNIEQSEDIPPSKGFSGTHAKHFLDSKKTIDIFRYPQDGIGKEEEKVCWKRAIYSDVSMLKKKDIGELNQDDLKKAKLALKRIARFFRLEQSRRKKRSRRHVDLDFSRTLRDSLKTGGWPIKLSHRARKARLKRLVILADVSGSMDRYAELVLPFLMGIRGVESRAEVFVFSTTLVCITGIVRNLPQEKVIHQLEGEFPEWSGGTKIGLSLHQFNHGEWGRRVNHRTVVLILSDGWDLGNEEILSTEMATLNRKAYRVIWLNPLAGNPDFKPVCKGMSAAFPYIDHLLPASNLENLSKVGSLLSRLMTV